MWSQLLLLCSLALVCNGQPTGNYPKKEISADISQPEETLIPAESRNNGRRGGNKKNSKDSDSYHVVYESKPESYSTSYHHEDKVREPTRSHSYRTNSGSGKGGRRNSYNNPYASSSSNSNRRQSQDTDYDDYEDNPQQQKSSRPYQSDSDYDSTDDRRDRGYDHKEEFDRSTKDDYHKTGELKDDFDHLGHDLSRGHRGSGSSGRRGGDREDNRRDEYSNSDSESGRRDNRDDDYDGIAFSRGQVPDGEDNPLDRYEQRTRQALREYTPGDGRAFLRTEDRRKK